MILHKETWACLALAWLSIGISAWSYRTHFEGGVSQEFCQYAEIGRNILEDRGFRTRAVFPFTLYYLDAHNIPFDSERLAPVLDRFPLQAYMTAAAEAILGKTDSAVAAVSTFLLALCVMATCVVGWRLMGPVEAILASLFLAVNPSFQRGFVLWGLPDFGFCFLTLVAAFMASSRPKSPAPRRQLLYWAGTGAVAGLAWLARSNFILWLPLFFWAIGSPKERRRQRWAAFLTGFIVASSPGWIYSLHWYGSIAPPTFAWNLAHHVVQDEYPLLSYRSFSVGDVVIHHFPALWRKFWLYLGLYIRDFPTLWQMHLLFPLMLFGTYDVEKTKDGARRFVRLAWAMLVVNILVFSLLRNERLGALVAGRYIIWWAPATFLLAARGITAIARRTKHVKMVDYVLAVAAIVWCLPYLTMAQGPHAYPAGFTVGAWPEIRAAADAAGPNGLVVTNMPAQMAWYGKRISVGLPADPADLLAIELRHPVSVVLISRLRIGELDQTPAWRNMLGDPMELGKFCKQARLKKISDSSTALLLGSTAPE